MRPAMLRNWCTRLPAKSSRAYPVQAHSVRFTRVMRPSGAIVREPQGAFSNRSLNSSLVVTSDERLHRGHDFLRRAQIRAMPGGVQNDHLASRYLAVHELADLHGGDDVLLALENQGRHGDLEKVGPVIGLEGHPREGLGDLG